jgi:hypothetical protein
MVHDHIRSELRPLAEVAAEHAEDIFRQLGDEGAREVEAEGMNPRRCALRARARPALTTGQGYELRTPLDGLFAERLTAEIARRRAGEVSTSATPRSTAMPPRSGRSRW